MVASRHAVGDLGLYPLVFGHGYSLRMSFHDQALFWPDRFGAIDHKRSITPG